MLIADKSRIIVFTRFPEPGKVKTRLIGEFGEKKAAALHAILTEYTLAETATVGVDVDIRYTGGTEAEMVHWLGESYCYTEQGEGDLGVRMNRAVSDHFAAGAEKVIVIGTDCPSNDAENIKRALIALDKSDMVLGPALDGGYYLIGFTKPFPEIFTVSAWGTSSVYNETLATATAHGVEPALLPILADIDTPADFDNQPIMIRVALESALAERIGRENF